MKNFFGRLDKREWLFGPLFLVVLFLLYSFDRDSPRIEAHKIVFFLHYMACAGLIGYVLIPLYFYPKKYVRFAIFLILVFLWAYLIEELVLEPIFFDNGRGRNVSNIFITLLDIAPLIVTMVSFKLAWDAKKKQSQLERLQLSAQESELQFLKSQINPHFLFNNLNNLYSYAIENSSKTPSIILELSSVLRYMLYDCTGDFVPLKKEIEHLRDFTSLNELQIEYRGKIAFNSTSVSDRYKIAPLILMVFIENAFKHSTGSQSNNILLNIHIDVSEQGELHFICTNSFLNNSNNQSLSKGIGLENVKKRLQILYPNKHRLTINDNGNIYKVNLTLQLESIDLL